MSTISVPPMSTLPGPPEAVALVTSRVFGNDDEYTATANAVTDDLARARSMVHALVAVCAALVIDVAKLRLEVETGEPAGGLASLAFLPSDAPPELIAAVDEVVRSYGLAVAREALPPDDTDT